jgi:hypothetical protein
VFRYVTKKPYYYDFISLFISSEVYGLGMFENKMQMGIIVYDKYKNGSNLRSEEVYNLYSLTLSEHDKNEIGKMSTMHEATKSQFY